MLAELRKSISYNLALVQRSPCLPVCLLWISFVRICVVLAGFGISMMFLVERTNVAPQSVLIVFWLLGAANDVFLLSHDYSYTNTYAGSVAFQALWSLLSFIWGIFSVFFVLSENGIDDFISAILGIIGSTVALHAISSALLLLSSSNLSGDNAVSAKWLVNSKDVVTGASYHPHNITWTGIPRNAEDPIYFVKGIKPVVETSVYISSIFFRRIKPVETRMYALVQNLFALFAIVTIASRVVVLLVQAQAEVFETRTSMGFCDSSAWNWMQLLVKHSESYGISPPTHLNYSFEVQVDVYSNNRQILEYSASCPSSFTTAYRGGDNTSSDWFEVFDCSTTISNAFHEQPRLEDYRFQFIYKYSMRSLNGTSLDQLQLPYIWLSASGRSEPRIDRLKNLTPWLVRSWQPIPSRNVTIEAGQKSRDFIVSSFFRDTITGMNPLFQSVWLFPLTPTQSLVLNDAQVSAGTIALTTAYDYSATNSLQSIQEQQKSSFSGNTPCEVTQDYRASTILDVLGSIGGLLALLQGIHLLLFGKPMFWGLFGTKLISPFGLIGRWGSTRFRERLQAHYHPTKSDDGEEQQGPQNTTRIFTFLQDYVIDFGPAELKPATYTTLLGGAVEDTEAYQLRQRHR